MTKSKLLLSMAAVAACSQGAKEPAAVTPIFTGLDQPKIVSTDALNALFGVPEQLSVPTFEQAFAPVGGSGGGSGTALSGQRQDSTDFANLTIASQVPQDFVDFIKSETSAAVTKFDGISGYADFKLADALRARKVDVTITDDASKFSNGRWFVGHECGSARCDHPEQCVAKVMVLYDPVAWADNRPWLIGAAHHEMFHVGEHYLYRQLGKLGIWYCSKGWHWQEEGFASFGARQMSGDSGYVYPRILGDAFFRWSPITDTAYDRSYETSALIDRLAKFSGKAVLPFQWVHDANQTEAPALGWLRLATGATGEMIDVSVFEGQYLHAAIDTVLPGALGSLTDAVAFAPPALVPQASLTLGAGALPQRLTSGVSMLSTSLFVVSLDAWPSNTEKIELKLTSSDANASYRALVVAADATLGSCYATFDSHQGDVSEGIQRCFSNNAKVLGALSPTDSLKLASSDLLAYAGSSLYIPVVRLFDNSVTSQLNVPANITLTIDKPTSNNNLDANVLTPDSGPPDTKKLDAAPDLNLCPASGTLPTCVCTYPDNYVGYTICGYGNNTDSSNQGYIWSKSDARYWGHEITCAPSNLCSLAKSCDFDKTKLCCSPNNSGIWNIECKFADPAFVARRLACCHN